MPGVALKLTEVYLQAGPVDETTIEFAKQFVDQHKGQPKSSKGKPGLNQSRWLRDINTFRTLLNGGCWQEDRQELRKDLHTVRSMLQASWPRGCMLITTSGEHVKNLTLEEALQRYTQKSGPRKKLEVPVTTSKCPYRIHKRLDHTAFAMQPVQLDDTCLFSQLQEDDISQKNSGATRPSMLILQAGNVTMAHEAPYGFATWFLVTSGAAVLMTCELEEDTHHADFSKWGPEFTGGRWSWHALRPTDCFFLPPGQIYAIFTPVNCVAIVYHMWHRKDLGLMMETIVRQHKSAEKADQNRSGHMFGILEKGPPPEHIFKLLERIGRQVTKVHSSMDLNEADVKKFQELYMAFRPTDIYQVPSSEDAA